MQVKIRKRILAAGEPFGHTNKNGVQEKRVRCQCPPWDEEDDDGEEADK